MRINTLILGCLIFSQIFIISCNNNKIDQNVKITPDFKSSILNLISKWNKAHLTKDIGEFSNLFNNSVEFYGTAEGKNSCLEAKLNLFKKHPDFYQKIFGDVEIEEISDSEIYCSFIKRVTINQKTSDYPSYLRFKMIDGEWKIITEGDFVTDKNLSKNQQNNTSIKKQESIKVNNKKANTFIKGLKKFKIFSRDQAEKGSEYLYLDGRKLNIKFFFEQVDIIFYSINENNLKNRIFTDFEAGYSTTDVEVYDLKNNTKFLVGQYDFDADEIDELIIAIQDNDENENGLSINVFKLKGDDWNQIGKMTGKMILGEPIAEIKINKITLPRNLRGFYYQWTYENNKFRETSAS